MTFYIDLDGPVLDVSSRHYAVYKTIISSFKQRPLGKKQYWEYKRDKESLDIVLSASGSGIPEPVFRKRWDELIEDKRNLGLDRVLPGVKKALTGLKKKKIRLVLATLRRSKKNMLWQLEEQGISPLFDKILSSDGVLPDGLKAAMISADLPDGENACIIGDTEVDIAAAKQLGIMSIAVLCGIRSKRELLKLCPDYIVNDLPGAITIAERMLC